MKKTKLLTSLAAFVLVLGLGACTEAEEETTSDESGEVTTTDTDTEETSGGETTGDSNPDGGNPSEGGNEEGTITYTYWLGYEYNGKTYYFDGKISASYYGSVTTTEGAGAEITIEELTDGYGLSFYDSDNVKQYIYLYGSGSYLDFGIQEEPFSFQWNADIETFVADLDGTTCYIGNYYDSNTTYNELRAMNLSELNSDSSKTYCVAHIYSVPIPETLVISGAQEVEVSRSILLSVVDENGKDTPVTWTSDDDTKATVNNKGNVTGVATGEVTITATSTRNTAVKADYKINVIDYVAKEAVKLGTYDFTQKTSTWDSAHGTTYALSVENVKATFDEYWTSDNEYSNPLYSVDATDQIFQYYTSGGLTQNQNNHGLIKTGSSSANGVIDITLTNTITKVEIDQQSWSTSENCTVTVNSISQESASKGVEETLTFGTGDDGFAESTSIAMTFAKRCYIYSITLYGYVD